MRGRVRKLGAYCLHWRVLALGVLCVCICVFTGNSPPLQRMRALVYAHIMHPINLARLLTKQAHAT